MGSEILTQVHCSIPRIVAPCPSKPGILLCFSLPSSFNSSALPSMLKTLSLNGVGSRTLPLVKDKRFAIKAQSNSEEEPSVVEDGDSQSLSTDEISPEEVAALEISDTQVESPPRKPRIKLGDIMGILNKRAVEASEKERPVPDIRTGDIVQIKLEVPENKRRASIYKGIVISRQNAGIHTTIRIRRIIAGIGVEIVFPLYSPNIKEIKVVSHRKVRRARLYYLRDKLPRFSTFK